MPSLAVVFVGFFHIWLTFITVPSSGSQFSMFSGVTACWLEHKEIPCDETAFESCGPCQKTNLQPASLPRFSAVRWFSPSVRTRLWGRPPAGLSACCVSARWSAAFQLADLPRWWVRQKGLVSSSPVQLVSSEWLWGSASAETWPRAQKVWHFARPFPSFKGRSKTCFGLHVCWGALNERRSISYFRGRRPLHLLIAVARPRGHRRPNWVMGQSS